MSSPLWDYLRETVFGLLVVVGLGLALLYAARRAGLPRSQGPLEVLAHLPLEARRSVYVVRILDQVLVLGASEAGLAKLGELPASAASQLRGASPRAGWVERWAARGAAGPAPEKKPSGSSGDGR